MSRLYAKIKKLSNLKGSKKRRRKKRFGKPVEVVRETTEYAEKLKEEISDENEKDLDEVRNKHTKDISEIERYNSIINVWEEILQKREDKEKFRVCINFDGETVLKSDTTVEVAKLPAFLWKRIKESFYKEINEFPTKFFTEYTPNGYVYIYCDVNKKDSSREFLKKLVRNYIKGSIINCFSEYRKIKLEELPSIKDIENYPDKDKELYKLALEGLENSDNFRILLIGAPGTGKTYFAKIASRYLIENEKIDCAFLEVAANIKVLLELIDNLKINDLEILFIVDEMETETLSRTDVVGRGTENILQLLDGMNIMKKFKMIGITNLPELIDKAIFRPGRIDMLIVSTSPDFSQESILRILKAVSEELKEKIDEKTLNKLAKSIFENFPNFYPISFYAHGIRLFKTYKNIEKTIKIMKIFSKHKQLYTYKLGQGIEEDKNVGFMGNIDEQ